MYYFVILFFLFFHSIIAANDDITFCMDSTTKMFYDYSSQNPRELTEIEKFVIQEHHKKQNLVKRIVMDRHDMSDDELLGFYDDIEPSLILLGPLDKNQIDHEITTARDYAKFLSRIKGRQFVFLNTFHKRSVPILDGIEIDEQGVPITNISLKFASIYMKVQRHDIWKDSAKGRLNYTSEVANLENAADWFKKVNHLEKLARVKKKENFQDLVDNSQKLMNLFSFMREGTFSMIHRELRTVVDVRDHGYPFEFFLDPELQLMVRGLIKDSYKEKFTLTLLWDDKRVIEFSKDRVDVYR